jgi:integrase
MAGKLKDTQCRNAKPKANPYKLADGGGMFLYITPAGGRSWRLKYRFGGKEKLMTFGLYPSVTLEDARKQRDAAKAELTTGNDPALVLKQAEQERIAAQANTFEDLAREWHGQNQHWTPQYRKNVLTRLEADLFPTLGARPIAEIKPLELLEAIRKIEARGAGEVARRLLQVAGQIYRYSIIIGRVDRDITSGLTQALKPTLKGHFKALPEKDLPAFMSDLESNRARLYRPTYIAMRMLLLTFVRTSELIGARWEEIDLDGAEWLIPGPRMKKRREHIIPLPRQALDLLRELKELTGGSEYLFSSRTKARGHMSNGAILMVLRRMGYADRATGHGFRAVAASLIREKLNYPRDVIEAQLAHVESDKTISAYHRAEFLPERRKMMQAWADWLDQQKRGEVLTFVKGALV